MLKIRLQMVGRKHEPRFRLVLTDSKNSTKSGKLLEILGNYEATHGQDSVFKADRIKYWMSVGAQVTATVHNLLIDKKIIEGKKINTLPLKKPIVKEKENVKEEIAPLDETPSEEVIADVPSEPILEPVEEVVA